MKHVVDESIDLLLSTSPAEAPRKNELSIALKKDTFKLFQQIEQGLAVEIRVQPVTPDSTVDDNTKAKLEDLRVLSRSLQFPQIAGQPILLTDGHSGEPHGEMEDDIDSTAKSASTKKAAKPKKSED